MMYRMVKHTPLSTGQKYGDILKDGDLQPSTIQRMLDSGTLIKVSAPPLGEFPEWEKRAELLLTAGIVTASDLAEADVNELAGKINRSVRIIKQWQGEALTWLTPKPSNKTG
jgi:hypothetical protein